MLGIDRRWAAAGTRTLDTEARRKINDDRNRIFGESEQGRAADRLRLRMRRS